LFMCAIFIVRYVIAIIVSTNNIPFSRPRQQLTIKDNRLEARLRLI
jgi:hypothetical protein